jgi:type I restriction enzyme S subunit
MNAQDLKNSILQLAMEGKLVEQRKEEGTARELLQAIQAEKEKLVAEKKIKKTKPLPPVTEEEKPFDIPESWEWVRLGEISSYNQPKEKVVAKDIENNIWSLELEDIEKSTGKIIKKVTRQERVIRGDRVVFHKGQILYSKLRPYLSKVLIAPDDGISSTEIVPFFVYGSLFQEYYLWVLRSPYAMGVVNSASYGVKMPRVGTDTMMELPIPLPPLAEQKRIVAKIEELLPYVEAYDKAQTRLQAFEEKFPEDMKKSILQYAMEGKLVEQRKEEGTARDLLQAIQAEKAKLVEEKKIKKTKPLPPVTEEEKPLDIPESWEWVRLGDVVAVLGGKRIPLGYKLSDIDTGHKYIRVSDMKNGSVALDSIKCITEDVYQKIKKYTISENDIYITVAGTIGRIGTIPHELDNANLTENADKLIIYKMNKEFLCLMLQAPFVQSQIKDVTTKVGQPKLAIKRIENFHIPLPPLAEQKRIVAKIEEMLPLVENMQKG